VKILALDLATRTGAAFGTAGEAPQFTSIDLGKGLSDPERFAKIIRATATLIQRLTPDIIVYEAPVGGPKTSHFLVGVAACFAGEAVRRGHDPKKLNIGAIRVHFIGRNITSKDFMPVVKLEQTSKPRTLKQMQSRAKLLARAELKRQVTARCHELGWKVRTEDEADACALFSYAGAKLCKSYAAPLRGLFK
jgi:hypothetical protein